MLSTKQLFLRQYTEEDVSYIIALYNDWKWEGIDEDFAHRFLSDVILKQYEHGGGILATFLKETDEYIGHCGLKFIKEKDEWYLSFRFLKAYWRNNLPTEAIDACLAWGFNRLNLKEIVVDLEERNTGAAKTLEKSGLKFRHIYEDNGQKLLRYSIFS
jgi:RimJ/RimL family protein N-acetyltransferase